MAHTSTENLSPSERDFIEFVQRGDDFYKIQLLRHAKSFYKKAMEMNRDNEKIEQKIAVCDKELAFERKVTIILVSIVIIAMTTWYLVF
jgi:hypothetical protein